MADAGERALDAFDKLGSTADSSYEAMTSTASQAARAVDNAAQSTDYWTDAIGNYDKGAMEAIYSTEELVEMGFKTEDALAATADGADKAAEEMDKYGDETEDAGKKSEEFGGKSTDAIGSLSSLLASAGIAVAVKEVGEALLDASENAEQFSTSIAKLTTVADTSVLSADQLAGQISSLSSDMAQNVNDITDSAYNAISAGVDTADAVSTVGTATELATAGFTSVSSALSVLTTATNAYNLDASEMEGISDSLIQTQNKGVLTIDQLSSSIGKAISTASAYSVGLDNLEAAYISLTKSGISVEESTTYVSSMFNELGDSGSAVAKVLQEQTGKTFGQLMNDGESLADVLDIVYQSTNNDSEAMMNLWGSAEAGKSANAIINQGLETFNGNLVDLQNSAGTTQLAYETMTNTSEYATQRMKNSFDNLSIAIGDDLNPAMTDAKNGIADLVDGFTDVVSEHPAISAALTGVVVGVGGVTIAVTGYTAVQSIATLAAGTFGVTLSAAIWPLTAVAAAVAGVTAAIVYFDQEIKESNDMTEHLTTTSQEMEAELNEVTAKYEEACNVYGKNSDEAYALKSQMDELNDSFEESKETIGELTSKIEDLGNSISEIHTTYEDAIASNGELEYSAIGLVTQLEAMVNKSTHTDSELQVMQGIVENLNGSYEGLNLTLDETSGKLNLSVSDLYQAVKDEADKADIQSATDALVQDLQLFNDTKSALDDATANSTAAKDNYYDMEEQWINDHPILSTIGKGAEMNWDSDLGSAFKEMEAQRDAVSDARDNYDELIEEIEEYCEKLGYSTEETEAFITQLESSSDAADQLSDSLNNTSNTVTTAEEASASAISDVQDQLQTLGQAYDDAFKKAQESVEGQYGLWESVDQVVSMTSDDISNALQSQIDYWTSYSDNLDLLTGKAASIEGLGDVLAAVADGSEDSASMLAGMASMSDEQLSAMVTQYTNLQNSQDDTASSMADLETDFSKSLDNMEKNMEDAVNSMDMADDAKAAAQSTMQGYIDGIKSKTSEVNSALSAITFSNSSITGLKGYASGTDDAEAGLKLVGEEGPEIINFQGGETVYDAEETNTILSGRNSGSDFYVEPSQNEDSDQGDSGDKTITLKIEGSGNMRVGSNLNKDEVVNILLDNMKDALMGIIQQEMLEEGDLAYDF